MKTNMTIIYIFIPETYHEPIGQRPLYLTLPSPLHASTYILTHFGSHTLTLSARAHTHTQAHVNSYTLTPAHNKSFSFISTLTRTHIISVLSICIYVFL